MPPWQNATESAIVSLNETSMHNFGNITAAARGAVNSTSVCSPQAARWWLDDAEQQWKTEVVSRPVCFHGVPAAGTRGPLFRTDGAATLRLPDGSLLASVIIPLNPKVDGKRCTLVAFRSDAEGFEWKYVGTIVRPADVPQSHEGPNENAFALLPDRKTVLCVMRLDAGDAGGFRGYARSVSVDGGVTWSAPELLGPGIGCARPRLLALDDGSLVLSGGRPRYNSRDPLIWLNAKGDGRRWREYSLSYWHNALVPNATRHFQPSINHSTSWPRESTSYTSLIATGSDHGFVVYNEGHKGFGGGWSMPFRVVRHVGEE